MTGAEAGGAGAAAACEPRTRTTGGAPRPEANDGRGNWLGSGITTGGAVGPDGGAPRAPAAPAGSAPLPPPVAAPPRPRDRKDAALARAALAGGPAGAAALGPAREAAREAAPAVPSSRRDSSPQERGFHTPVAPAGRGGLTEAAPPAATDGAPVLAAPPPPVPLRPPAPPPPPPPREAAGGARAAVDAAPGAGTMELRPADVAPTYDVAPALAPAAARRDGGGGSGDDCFTAGTLAFSDCHSRR